MSESVSGRGEVGNANLENFVAMCDHKLQRLTGGLRREKERKREF